MCAKTDSIRHPALPQQDSGYWLWPVSGSGCEMLFVGKGPQRDRSVAYATLAPPKGPSTLSWPRQLHSAVVREAGRSGLCGDADALVTDDHSRALSVVTADCVPIVIAGNGRLAVVHAGWRGLAGRIVQRTLETFDGSRHDLVAWLGPAIGACCYEVDWDVADTVTEASDPSIVRAKGDRPRIDLARAARIQLQQDRVRSVRTLDVCTKCSPQWLWSHRRDQPDTGRNWTFAWLREK